MSLLLWNGYSNSALHSQATGYRRDDHPVRHLVLWEGQAGNMLIGQGAHITYSYIKRLQLELCCETVDELQQKMKDRHRWALVSHTASE